MENYLENGSKRFQLEMSDYIKIEILGYVKTSSNDICGMHRHPFWELIYSKEGEGLHRAGEDTFALGRDEICLIPPEVPHDCTNEKPSENIKLYIGFSYNYSFSAGVFKNGGLLPGNSNRLEAIKTQLRELCGQLEKGDVSMEDIKAGKIIAIISQLISCIFTEIVPVRKLQDIRNRNLVEKVKEYLGNNLCRTVKLSELGSMLYLSPHYIGDTFKKVTGTNMKQYHHMLRMEYAYRLVEDTGLSISEIALELGFDSIHYFSRRFKERYGFSPSQIRKG